LNDGPKNASAQTGAEWAETCFTFRMMLALGIFACLFLFAVALTAIGIRNAPEGVQDERGFHQVKSDRDQKSRLASEESQEPSPETGK
jgi:hypothetical protein